MTEPFSVFADDAFAFFDFAFANKMMPHCSLQNATDANFQNLNSDLRVVRVESPVPLFS